MKRRLRPMAVMLSLSKHLAFVVIIAITAFSATVRAETETIDLKALAKKARPAVMLLVVSDANGKEIATGTGFLVSSDGKLITNHHVIEGAASAVAKAENGGLFPIEGVLADDPKNDLVLLKLKGQDLPFLPLGNSDKIEAGTRIAVIGSPLGLEGTVSEGIVSAVRDLMGDIKVIQVTAAISPGSSGSPVMDSKGDVVGIASALLRGGQALNFAVPAAYGISLVAKVKSSSVPQSFHQSAKAGGQAAVFSDPDWRATWAAEAATNYVEMLKHAKLLVERYPNFAWGWYGLGSAFGGLNFTADAIAAYKHAIKITPDDPLLWHDLGWEYDESGQTDNAIMAYQQAIKIEPEYARAWCNLGIVYGKSGRIDEEILAYRQAIKIIPDHAQAWENLAATYYKSGRIKNAIAVCREFIKIKPDDKRIWFRLGIYLIAAGNEEQAKEAFQRDKLLNPSESK
jgi:tetratricopeptide (TPR) repeat protein